MSLFDEIVAASRLSPLLAPFTMTRLLVKAGFSPQRVTHDELGEALPVIRDGLATYLDEHELEEAMSALERLSRGPDRAAHAS